MQFTRIPSYFKGVTLSLTSWEFQVTVLVTEYGQLGLLLYNECYFLIQAAAGETDDLLGLGDPVTSTQSTQPPPSQPPESKSPPPEAKAPPPTAPTTTTQQLEDELELDLENMKIDENIDTSVSHPPALFCDFTYDFYWYEY